MDLDFEKKTKTKKIVLKKTFLAIILSNLFQFSLHLLFKEDKISKGKKVEGVKKGLVIVSISPKLFVPRHVEGKQLVSLVSKDQKDIIPKAYLHPVSSRSFSETDGSVYLEVPEKSLNKIIKRKSDWEVYPFTQKIRKKRTKRLGDRYEISF